MKHTNTVKDLKLLIEEAVGIAEAEFVLIFNGKRLEEFRCLGEWDELRDGSSVVVKTKLAGGARRKLAKSDISEFAVKPGDDAIVIAALTYQFVNFDTFIGNLTPELLTEFNDYVGKQRNTVTVNGEWLANTTMRKTLGDGAAPGVSR